MEQTQCYRIQVSILRIHKTTDRPTDRLSDHYNPWRGAAGYNYEARGRFFVEVLVSYI